MNNSYVLIGLAILAFLVALWLVITIVRMLAGGRLKLPGGRTRQARLGIVDAFDLDRQRQLIIVRRDNTEHLIMIGGPNDLVIESEIVRVEARDAREVRRDKGLEFPAAIVGDGRIPAAFGPGDRAEPAANGSGVPAQEPLLPMPLPQEPQAAPPMMAEPPAGPARGPTFPLPPRRPAPAPVQPERRPVNPPRIPDSATRGDDMRRPSGDAPAPAASEMPAGQPAQAPVPAPPSPSPAPAADAPPRPAPRPAPPPFLKPLPPRPPIRPLKRATPQAAPAAGAPPTGSASAEQATSASAPPPAREPAGQPPRPEPRADTPPPSAPPSPPPAPLPPLASDPGEKDALESLEEEMAKLLGRG